MSLESGLLPQGLVAVLSLYLYSRSHQEDDFGGEANRDVTQGSFAA